MNKISLHTRQLPPRPEITIAAAGNGEVVVVLKDYANLPIAVFPDTLKPHIALNKRFSVRETANRQQRPPTLTDLSHHRQIVFVRELAVLRNTEGIPHVLRVIHK